MSRLFSAAAAVALFASGANAETLVTAQGDPVGTLKDRMCSMFIEGVTSRTDEVDFNYVQGESLGSAPSIMEQHIAGAVDIFCNEAVWFADYAPDFQILGWGFTFRDVEHAAEFFESEEFAPLEAAVLENGVRILAVRPTQQRMMFSTFPITSVDDVQDIKMRVPGLKAYLELWTAMGTRPTQVSWSEVYLALSTGVVVAAEGPPTDAMAQNFHQVATNIIRTDHLYSTAFVSINEESYAGLSNEVKAILEEEATKATEWAMAEGQAEVALRMEEAEAAGATIMQIDSAPFAARSREAVAAMEAEGLWSEGLWQTIQDMD